MKHTEKKKLSEGNPPPQISIGCSRNMMLSVYDRYAPSEWHNNIYAESVDLNVREIVS